jgi:hypothetical protein
MSTRYYQTNRAIQGLLRIEGAGKILLNIAFLAVLLIAVAGCTQTTLTAPQRSATEQLLLSTAADRAIGSTNLAMFDGKKVFFDTTYFDSYDAKYVEGAIRDALNRAGALLVRVETNSDVVIEPRAGALSIDAASTLVGVPSSGLPVPLAGTVSIPELALYKTQKQFSLAKLALLAYDTHSGKHYYSSGPLIGKAYNHYYSIIGFITFTSSDIPAKHRTTSK